MEIIQGPESLYLCEVLLGRAHAYETEGAYQVIGIAA